jgi:hypothetical protein
MPRTVFACAVAALLAAPLAAPVLASAATAPAVPDFYRNATPWSTSKGKNFFAPPPGSPGAAGPIGNHPDHPSRGNETGMPTPRVGNDLNPLLTPWAAGLMRRAREAIEAGAEPFDPSARCWMPGVPAILTFGVAPMYFLQTPNEVTIVYERGQLARHVYLTRQHSPNPKPSWHGESIGWYEGDTLVVDTIGFNGKTHIDVFGVPSSTKLHVVERYRIVNNELHVLVTVEDPEAFKQPFSMFKSFEVGDEPRMQEIICQEAGEDPFYKGEKPLPVATKVDF